MQAGAVLHCVPDVILLGTRVYLKYRPFRTNLLAGYTVVYLKYRLTRNKMSIEQHHFLGCKTKSSDREVHSVRFM